MLGVSETFQTVFALERLCAGMFIHMTSKMILLNETLITYMTLVCLFSSMHVHMKFETSSCCKYFTADRTFQLLFNIVFRV